MKKNRRGNRAGVLIVVFLCVALVFAALWGIVTGIAKLMHYGETVTIQTTPEQEQSEETPETVPNLPQKEEDALEKNTYSADGFYEIDGIRFYHGGDWEGVAGVDVSSWQKNIDWTAVKEAGIDFAIIQVGYRGYSEGKLNVDSQFHTHMQGAIDAGLDVGVYFFSQALTPEEAKEEADFVLEQLDGYTLQYPVVFDWEEITTLDDPEVVPRTDEMNMLMLTSCALAFCQTVEEAGYQAGIYFNQAYGYEQLNLLGLKDYTFWLAEYQDAPNFAYHFQMWQYTNEGTVPGIQGPVDLNIAFRKRDG